MHGLNKAVWDDDDFDCMGWHDVFIYGWAALVDDYELAFDIDYIVQWVKPARGEQYFQFWVAPATLVFSDVSQVQVHLESQLGEITLQELRREDRRPTPAGLVDDYLWTMDANEGTLAFRATGFRQYFRRRPFLVDTPRLSLTLRGAPSFERIELHLDDNATQ